MHYFLYPSKDTTLSNHPSFMFKNMGLDEILEVEKRISGNSCSSTDTFSVVNYFTSSSIELLSGSMSASFDSGSTDPKPVSSSYTLVYGPTTLGSVLSRALIQFDLTDISKSIASNEVGRPVDPKFYLNLKVCESVEVPLEYTLAAYPISQSWGMGTGYKYDDQASADGATWKYVDGSTKTWYGNFLGDCSGGGVWWVSASLKGSGSGYAEPPNVSTYNPYPDCASSSYVPPSTGSGVNPVTGGFACYQTFNYQTSDVRMDITPIVNAWLTQQIPNNGLVVMHSDESSSLDYGSLRFFSKETNTIYSPHLDVAWYDATLEWTSPSFNTSSADPIRIKDAVVNIKNMTTNYNYDSIVRFDVTPRKRYPIKTFTNKVSDYLHPYYLPSQSFYQIKDAESEETIIPYDDYTRISFDSGGNYFMLDMSGLPQERYYKVQIRTEESGSIMTFDIPTTFKVSR